VNGKEERHPEGAYYLEWREGSKRVRLSVGKDPADASARRLRKEASLERNKSGNAAQRRACGTGARGRSREAEVQGYGQDRNCMAGGADANSIPAEPGKGSTTNAILLNVRLARLQRDG
jgi:hypothetical protein